MKKIKFTNEYGDSIEIGAKWPYVLEDINGVESPSKTVSAIQMFNQDGNIYLGSHMSPRYINCMVTIKGTSKEDVEVKKSRLYEVFGMSTKEGELIYNNGVNEYRISAAVYDGPVESSIKSVSENVLRIDIGFFCANPAWESKVTYQTKLVGFVGGLTIPYILPYTLATQGDRAEITNNGHMDTPMLIEFRGAASMPKLIKEETGETIELELETNEGESLFINTNPYDIDIYKMVNGVRIDANNYVKPVTEYFQLTKGKNTISFSAAGGEPEVYISYRERFIGA